MTSILVKKKRFRVLQTETIAMPEGSTELYVEVSQLTITLRFHSREAGELKVELDAESAPRIEIDIYGFHNSLGSSFDATLGDIDGKKLTMSAMAHGVGEKSDPPRVFTLTFLLEE
ncbi:DUF6864 domain-containing function [Rhizobium laguerreae]|uniref:DUF6864 domain-containing function n=1 Tax=Rhizobium laguerreae TaxID=1076926 RepID=UPI001C915DBE|nr:hypothetical protein [Rhizobium laguerreae]MBY3228559.1 hypothetical protein [Rhizobium laguerreae]